MGLDIHIHLDLDLDMSKEMGSLLNNLMETYMLELYIHCPVKDRHKMGLYNWFHRLVNNTVEYNIRLLGLDRNSYFQQGYNREVMRKYHSNYLGLCNCFPELDRHNHHLDHLLGRHSLVSSKLHHLGLGRNRLEELYNSHQENNKVKHINLVLHSQILVMHNRFQVCSKEKCMFHQVNNRQENSKSESHS